MSDIDATVDDDGRRSVRVPYGAVFSPRCPECDWTEDARTFAGDRWLTRDPCPAHADDDATALAEAWEQTYAGAAPIAVITLPRQHLPILCRILGHGWRPRRYGGGRWRRTCRRCEDIR